MQRNVRSFVYLLNDNTTGQKKKENQLSDQQMQKILETLSKQAIKDKTPNFNELEDILRHEINTKKEEQQNTNSELQNSIQEDGRYSLTKLLKDKGYLKEEKNWLTNKGFFEVGRKILQDIMYELNQSELGFHETHYVGGGNVIIDTTKKFETGSDIKFLSVPHTVLNAVQRQSKISKNIQFPLVLEPDDLEEFETLDDVRVAIVYCIDLSSTMKYSIGKSGKSRIEAAKRALWSLYVLNKKFFPNDSISIVGFASMASVIDPFDIPFLKTFDTNDNFLHYTNYQAAFRLARKILQKSNTQNKRIVMITDGQPSACFIENEHQKTDIISEKPYSNFYVPDKSIISRVRAERNLKLDQNQGSLVYLCYRYKKVDPKINLRTLLEGKKCLHHGIQIDTIVVSEETELVNYVQEFEKELKGRTYHINQENMDTVLVHDYLFKIKKIIHNKQHW